MKPRRKTVLKSTVIMGVGTLLSRILGMFRDAATAAMLGMSAGGIMDSFVLAFRLPDVTRRMFGEGSLSVSFIPQFARLWNEDRKKAWQLVSFALVGIFLLLLVIVLIGEALCTWAIFAFPPQSKVNVAARLTAVMLPYLILICMAAIAAAALQTLGKFFVPSLIPTILNIVWLFGILILAPRITENPLERCYLLAGCIVFAGCIQLGIQIPLLRKAGFRCRNHWRSVRKEAGEVVRSFFPTMLGLTATQLNILVASGIAWAFSGPVGEAIWWLGRQANYPLQPGSASSIYFSERLYEFPQGLLGLAIATAIYPLLSRHAARKDYAAIADDLGFGLRVIFALAIPSGVGLMFFSDNLAHLLYQRGAFTPSDMYRTGDMIFWFSLGVSGFCSIPLLVRAFYAIGDIRTPVLIGGFCSLVNLVLGFSLIWVMSEQGLAFAAAYAATMQALLLLIVFSLKHRLLDFRRLGTTIARSLFASCLMGLVIKTVMESIPGASSLSDILRITAAGGVGSLVFVVVFFKLGGRELESIFSRRAEAKRSARKKRKKRRR